MNKIFLIAASACFAAVANAYVVFDFEEFASTSGGALTSLSSTKSSVTLRIVRDGGATFDIRDNNSFPSGFDMPLTWDDRSLDPFANAGTDDFFVGTFSVGMTQVEVEFTDFGADDDTAMVIAYSGANGTGAVLDTQSVSWGTKSSPSYVGVGVRSDTPILSIAFRGGSSGFPNSMFIDNIAAEPVPEPATMAALGLGAAALIRRRRK